MTHGRRIPVLYWFDGAGPVVRPYPMTRGRTGTSGEHKLDLIALVLPEPAADDPGREQTFAPEHVEIVRRPSRPTSDHVHARGVAVR
jgi:hypothetical protein